MKRCPVCKTVFPDDANFCPMDAKHLEEVPAATVASPATPSLDLPTMQARLVGGRFQVGPQIGGRRTGEVFSAEDITTGQACAVKIVSPAVFPTPLVAQRTERELKQLMKVVSDRITRVIEVGKQGDRLYVAMELVSGVTLAEILAGQGPIPPDQAARLAVEVGEGLAEAAKLGVIHRDVSPKNIVVVADARGTRRVKLLNFGIPTPVTEKVLGVPEFLSPELAEGKPVDQRSNIYSMGALLYTMLTGAPPFSGTPLEVLRQQSQGAPTPPSQRAPGHGISTELERLIMKALEKASSRRHLTLRQLLGELETIAAHLPLTHPVTVDAPGRPSGSIPAQRQSSSHAVQAPPDGKPAGRERHSAARTMVGMAFPIPQAPPPASPAGSGASQPRAKQAPAPASPQLPETSEPAVHAHAPPVVASPAAQLFPQQEAAAPGTTVPARPAAVAAAPPRSSSSGGSGGRPREGAPAPAAKKGKFRETMWFKKGEAEEVPTEDEATPPVIDDLPIEDRYKDDGTITAADRERLSLRTGDTAFGMKADRAPVVPGERMGEDDLARELRGGNTRLFLIIASVVMVTALVVVYFLAIR